MKSVGELLGRCLLAVGVERVYGRAVPGLPHVRGDENDALLRLLADGDGRLGPGPGCSFLADGELRITSKPGARAKSVDVTDVADLPAAVALAGDLARLSIDAGVVSLDLDLDAPVPPDVAPIAPAADPEARPPLPPVDGPVVMLVGPGVLRARAERGLHSFADAAGIGVANTWGAKGVFPWDSPHHMGTAGLQEQDFELLGFGDAAAILASGLDPDESPFDRFASAPVQAVVPQLLSVPLAEHLAVPDRPAVENRLYERLAGIAQPGYVDDKLPLHPARAVADLRAVLPARGVLAAQPGFAGLWVARTFPTTEPGSVIVPATAPDGAAAAIACAAGRRGRPAIAVVDDPVDDITQAIIEHAPRLGSHFTLDVWSLFGDMSSVDAHRHALEDARRTSGPGVTVIRTPVDVGDIRLLTEAAGSVVAWGGLAP